MEKINQHQVDIKCCFASEYYYYTFREISKHQY